MMIRICLAGLSGSGKTTLGEMLAKELNIDHIQKSYKDVTANEKELLSMQKSVARSYEKDFDKQVIDMAKGKNCVISTWLCAWFIKDATLRVWLNASHKERARRLMKLKQKGRTFIEDYLREKDQGNLKRWQKVYGVDLKDHSIFDIELNTENFTPQEMVSIISVIALERDKKKFA
jgi:cytidylate kinase